MRSIAGVVVLFNPKMDVLSNINTYARYMEILYVVDNSDRSNETLVEEFEKMDNIRYIKQTENKGIAQVLNQIMGLATQYEWLLTMDQDSYFHEKDIREFLCDVEVDFVNCYSICPVAVSESEYNKLKKKGVRLITSCITSGCLLNIKNAKCIGGFDENLFIDGVDIEFCYRGNLKGYKLYQNTNVQLIHHLGNKKNEQFLKFFQYTCTHHNYQRHYYIFRNFLYIGHLYPKEKMKIYKYLLKRFLKILLWEKDKIQKFKSSYYGCIDYYNNQFGKKYFNY